MKPKSRLFAYFQTYALSCAAVRNTKGTVKTTKPAVIYTQALFVQSPNTNLFFASGIPFMKKIMLSSQLLGDCVAPTNHLPSENDRNPQTVLGVCAPRVERGDWPSKSDGRPVPRLARVWLGHVPPRA